MSINLGIISNLGMISKILLIWSQLREKIQTVTHYIPPCPNYLNKEITLLSNLQNTEENILDRNDFRVLEMLLFSDSSFSDAKKSILNATFQYNFDTKRFHVSLTNIRKLLKPQKFENPFTVLSPPMDWGHIILIRLFLLYIVFCFM